MNRVLAIISLSFLIASCGGSGDSGSSGSSGSNSSGDQSTGSSGGSNPFESTSLQLTNLTTDYRVTEAYVVQCNSSLSRESLVVSISDTPLFSGGGQIIAPSAISTTTAASQGYCSVRFKHEVTNVGFPESRDWVVKEIQISSGGTNFCTFRDEDLDQVMGDRIPCF